MHLRKVNSYIVNFFQTRNTQKKRDFLSEKRESGMTLKKREFTPESGSVDTYDVCKKREVFMLLTLTLPTGDLPKD